MAKMAELSLKGQEVHLKAAEAARRQAFEEAEMQLRERHDAALIEKEQAAALQSRSSAVLNLAQADAAVGQVTLGALSHQLDAIKAQMDAIADARLADTQAAVDPSTTTPGTPEAASQPSAPST
jgi:ADP-ribose pyrophosphatase YjhB (NUDIX family)